MSERNQEAQRPRGESCFWRDRSEGRNERLVYQIVEVCGEHGSENTEALRIWSCWRRRIYMEVLTGWTGPRGFRYDQLGIEDTEIWAVAYVEEMGRVARAAPQGCAAMSWWGLSLRQESKIHEAAMKGIKPARIAEPIGCTERQVLAVLADYRRLKADRDAWDAVIEAERAKGQ